MKYLLALVTSLALVLSPVYAADAPAAPVKKGKLMLAKKKDHSQDNMPKAKKGKK
jgi:opacity protein-like surface antigen